MDTLTNLVARILYAVPLGIFGILHFVDVQGMSGMVPDFLPFAGFWVVITGIALILAAVSILIEKQTRLACILLGIMLLIFVLTIHLPGVIGAETDPEMQQAMSSLLKDAALAGAAWFIAGKYSDNEGGES